MDKDFVAHSEDVVMDPIADQIYGEFIIGNWVTANRNINQLMQKQGN